ncbi:YolD-like family protein [Neobacillus sp. YIM B02564]|uniref:YolD-like family protein n=1 Tax=Neobacillus paridis TaxID=2803862 RepID=A0ABS1TLF9_9BACI|nr:YolD-like family protein [Neobacillus paridis]MBL4952077.1 YolD-like family protein [Neobacillus paridis]
MLKDRGTKKWTAMMLPEHVRELKKCLNDEIKIKRPILDEQKIERMEETIIEALDANQTLEFSIYEDGFIEVYTGKITFIDHIQKQFKIMDGSGHKHLLSFRDVINIEKSEGND